MKWNQIGKRLIPSFFNRRGEEKHMTKEMDHLLYEIYLNKENSHLDLDAVKKIILMNPWCLLTKPSVVFSENPEDKSMTISFHVLSKEKGKEVERLILEHLK